MTLNTLLSILEPYQETDGDIAIEVLHWDFEELEYVPWPLDTVKVELSGDGLVRLQLRPCDPARSSQ